MNEQTHVLKLLGLFTDQEINESNLDPRTIHSLIPIDCGKLGVKKEVWIAYEIPQQHPTTQPNYPQQTQPLRTMQYATNEPGISTTLTPEEFAREQQKIMQEKATMQRQQEQAEEERIRVQQGQNGQAFQHKGMPQEMTQGVSPNTDYHPNSSITNMNRDGGDFGKRIVNGEPMIEKDAMKKYI